MPGIIKEVGKVSRGIEGAVLRVSSGSHEVERGHSKTSNTGFPSHARNQTGQDDASRKGHSNSFRPAKENSALTSSWGKESETPGWSTEPVFKSVEKRREHDNVDERRMGHQNSDNFKGDRGDSGSRKENGRREELVERKRFSDDRNSSNCPERFGSVEDSHVKRSADVSNQMREPVEQFGFSDKGDSSHDPDRYDSRNERPVKHSGDSRDRQRKSSGSFSPSDKGRSVNLTERYGSEKDRTISRGEEIGNRRNGGSERWGADVRRDSFHGSGKDENVTHRRDASSRRDGSAENFGFSEMKDSINGIENHKIGRVSSGGTSNSYSGGRKESDLWQSESFDFREGRTLGDDRTKTRNFEANRRNENVERFAPSNKNSTDYTMKNYDTERDMGVKDRENRRKESESDGWERGGISTSVQQDRDLDVKSVSDLKKTVYADRRLSRLETKDLCSGSGRIVYSKDDDFESSGSNKFGKTCYKSGDEKQYSRTNNRMHESQSSLQRNMSRNLNDFDNGGYRQSSQENNRRICHPKDEEEDPWSCSNTANDSGWDCDRNAKSKINKSVSKVSVDTFDGKTDGPKLSTEQNGFDRSFKRGHESGTFRHQDARLGDRKGNDRFNREDKEHRTVGFSGDRDRSGNMRRKMSGSTGDSLPYVSRPSNLENPPNDREVRFPSSKYIPEEPNEESVFAETAYDVGVNFENLFDAEVKGLRESREIKLIPCKGFDKVWISPVVLENVIKAGYKRMTPIQQYVIPLISEGRDVMACAPTGCGKTAAFLLPIITMLVESKECVLESSFPAEPRCIVISPTRELARQLYYEAVKFGAGSSCKASIVYGGTSCVYQRGQLELQKCTLLVASIGRLNHFIDQGWVSLQKVKYVVVDEADRMLDMNFDVDLNRFLSHKDFNRGSLQTMMFSATFPKEVQQIAEKYLKEDFTKVTVDHVGAANKCIIQKFIEVPGADKKDALLELLNIDVKTYKIEADGDSFKQKTLVFVNKRTLADLLGGIICQAGLPAITIHGKRYQGQREEALHLFRTGVTPVLIATAVAERGLDINCVDHVINYDLPKDRKEYVHRIGRTGRVGNIGRATSFYDRVEDQEMAAELVSVLREVNQEPPEFLLRDSSLASLSQIKSSSVSFSVLPKVEATDGFRQDYDGW